MSDLTRSTFLRRAAVTAAAAGAGGWAVSSAAAAPSETDLAWVRFGITIEYVSAAYYLRARRSGWFDAPERRTLERATAAQNAHLTRLRELLMASNQLPIDKADIEVELDERDFAARRSTIALGRRIQALALHAYLGAVTTVDDEALRRVLGQIAASEAEQLAFLTGLAGPLVTDPFPSVHGLATAADELARFLP